MYANTCTCKTIWTVESTFFKQKYIFSLLGENDENAELWYHSDYHDMLLSLYQHDERHKSNNLQLLNVYLRYERNATESAKELNMHRNNVNISHKPHSGYAPLKFR